MQNLGGQTECIMGNWKIVNSGQLGNFTPKMIKQQWKNFPDCSKETHDFTFKVSCTLSHQLLFSRLTEPSLPYKNGAAFSIRQDKAVAPSRFFAFLNVRPMERIQDSFGFWIPSRGFRIPGIDSGICQVNLNSGFQSLVGFRIPRAVFRTQKLRIPDTTSKILLNSGSHKQKCPGF